MNDSVQTPPSMSQQAQLSQQPRIVLSPQVQAELTALNIRYHDLQETMSRLITLLASENAELKQQLAELQGKQT